MRARARRYLIFLPGLVLGLVGAVWLLFRPLELEAEAGFLTILLTALVVAAILLTGAYILERLLASFRYASKLLERAFASFPMSPPLAFTLAALTATGEELFFRGALLPLLGVWGQALVFALMHPAPKRAWSYTAYTFFAGLLLGYATVFTGSLWAPILAHFLVNLHGFLEVRRLQRAKNAS